MDNAKIEELVIKLEESLGFSSLESGPKLIRAIIADKQWPSNLAIEEAPTHMMAYWIQVHGIHLNLMSIGKAKEIGEKLGAILEAELKYERLPDFCFDCGRLCHTQNGCKFHPKKNEDGESGAFMDWMKARAVLERRNQVSLNVPRGVHRRAGQTGVLNPCSRVAHVAQKSGENEIVEGTTTGLGTLTKAHLNPSNGHNQKVQRI
ncbi:hypothetical protein L3X38_018182 [Prunus dulcis]|uniref:Zinc knuckle CX2CX4HX4C domain-containing protein n=1 Tax=Prunus dulcis TaxID=3755 RepID=A0AAD4W8I6_PRUDU|nr:hypothetical protein L3X38_018182 [Prunus dulcis]